MWLTRVIRSVTSHAHEPRAALAAERVDAVHTGAAVVARVSLAFVDVGFTGLSRKPSRTGALEVIFLRINKWLFY